MRSGRPWLRLVKALVWLGACLAGGALFLGLLLGAFLWHFHIFAPKPDYPKPASALEAQRQDLDYFAKLMTLDRAFSPAARAEGEKRVAALRNLSVPLPPPKLHVALMQVMALADNGHSRMRPTAPQGTPLLPVRVTRFAEGFYVMRAASAHSGLLGGRVEAINGMPFEQVLARLETLKGGTEGFRRENAAVYIVVQELLYGLGIASDPHTSTWTVRLPDGRVTSETLAATPQVKGEELPNGVRWLSPAPLKGSTKDWIAYRPASGAVPQTWRDFDNHFRSFSEPGSCTVTVRLQHIVDTDGQKIVPFLDDAETALRARPPCAVILDLRGDSGGDYTKAWRFTHALPGLLAPGGHIFVLTDPQTFSAAITATAFVKEAGGDKVRIIGEPVGDRLSFFSEGGSGCLPNLKVCISYQTGKHDYAHPCRDWRECFWLNWFYPVRVKSLQPDVIIPLRFADWNQGHDAAYEEALARAARNAPV